MALPFVYWFRLPDDEPMLMTLKPAELRCYLVVLRDIQRAKNSGLISTRQVADRAGISSRHTHAALKGLVAKGRLRCEKRPGATARYSLPFDWQKHDRSPMGEQSPAGLVEAGEQSGEHHRSPVGKRKRSPVGEQHLESSESSEKRVFASPPVFVSEERLCQADCGHASQNPRSGARPQGDAPSLGEETPSKADHAASSATPTKEERPSPEGQASTKPWSKRELAAVRSRIAGFMEAEPSEGFEVSVMLRVRGASAAAVLAVLDLKYADRNCRPDGRWAPRHENWFLEMLSNELCGQHFHEPPATLEPLSVSQQQFNAAALDAIEFARKETPLQSNEIRTEPEPGLTPKANSLQSAALPGTQVLRDPVSPERRAELEAEFEKIRQHQATRRTA